MNLTSPHHQHKNDSGTHHNHHSSNTVIVILNNHIDTIPPTDMRMRQNLHVTLILHNITIFWGNEHP